MLQAGGRRETKRTRSMLESERAVGRLVLPPHFIGQENGEETLLKLVIKWN